MKLNYERLIQIEGLIKDVHEFACDKLNIYPVRVNIVEHVEKGLRGYATTGILHEITIVESNITTYEKLIGTVLHETRHVWQFTRKDIDWKWDAYVESHVDYEAYYNHMTEVDARTFAKVFANKFNKELQVFIDKCKNNEYEIPVPKERELDELELLFGIDTRNEPTWG